MYSRRLWDSCKRHSSGELLSKPAVGKARLLSNPNFLRIFVCSRGLSPSRKDVLKEALEFGHFGLDPGAVRVCWITPPGCYSESPSGRTRTARQQSFHRRLQNMSRLQSCENHSSSRMRCNKPDRQGKRGHIVEMSCYSGGWRFRPGSLTTRFCSTAEGTHSDIKTVLRRRTEHARRKLCSQLAGR